ncbi:MAG: hypothetical protein KDD53_11660, partial [Bdellovibrionales bacterium]|nr:hypothetical protein [Bdellovibrionales bacterium]
MCAPDIGTTDFRSAAKTLNATLRVGLGQLQINVLGLYMTGLSPAPRFSTSTHLLGCSGENTAVHSFNTVVLLGEMDRRAGLLRPEMQSEDLVKDRCRRYVAGWVHDGGEIPGEISTVDGRTRDDSLTEDPLLERKIFIAAMRMAHHAVVNDAPSEFYSWLNRLRQTAGILVPDQGNPEEFSKMLNGAARIFLPREAQSSVEFFLRHFDLAELGGRGISGLSLFDGYVVKAVEHLQGTRHLLRFGAKEKGFRTLKLASPLSILPGEEYNGLGLATPPSKGWLPMSLQESSAVLGTLSYIEGELGHIFAHAATNAQFALANVVRDMVYLTAVEYLHATSPVIDRSATKGNTEVKELIDALKLPYEGQLEIQARVSRLRDRLVEQSSADLRELQRMNRGSGDDLRRFESQRRLMDLYMWAV